MSSNLTSSANKTPRGVVLFVEESKVTDFAGEIRTTERVRSDIITLQDFECFVIKMRKVYSSCKETVSRVGRESVPRPNTSDGVCLSRGRNSRRLRISSFNHLDFARKTFELCLIHTAILFVY